MIKDSESTILLRHADKGMWPISSEEITSALPHDKASLLINTLKEEFPNLKETPITLDGITRALNLADKIYAQLPKNGVLIATDSGKDRAEFTRTLINARIAQLESIDQNTNGKDAKRIDMAVIEDTEIIKALQDTDPATWEPYGKMIKKENISEAEAIARWINEQDALPNAEDAETPKASAKRYRKLIRSLRQRITGKKVPVIFLGVGHSGPLSQARYEKQGRPMTDADVAKFCEIFEFDADGNLIQTEETEI